MEHAQALRRIRTAMRWATQRPNPPDARLEPFPELHGDPLAVREVEHSVFFFYPRYVYGLTRLARSGVQAVTVQPRGQTARLHRYDVFSLAGAFLGRQWVLPSAPTSTDLAGESGG